jgi:hypothetical protein
MRKLLLLLLSSIALAQDNRLSSLLESEGYKETMRMNNLQVFTAPKPHLEVLQIAKVLRDSGIWVIQERITIRPFVGWSLYKITFIADGAVGTLYNSAGVDGIEQVFVFWEPRP